MSDPEKKYEHDELWTVLHDFLTKYDGHLAGLLYDEEHLNAILPHMHQMTQEEKEEIRCEKTPIGRGKAMLDFVCEEKRETFDLQKEFLNQVCKVDPQFQKIFRSELKDYLGILVGKFQYSRTSSVQMFPDDSKAYELLKEEFNSSAGNPFLPTFQDFASKCLPNEQLAASKGLTTKVVSSVLERWEPKKGSPATVEDIVRLVESLDLWALREKLVAEECFGVYIKEADSDSKSEEDDFCFKHWKADPIRAIYNISRHIHKQDECVALAYALPQVSKENMDILQAVESFKPGDANKMMATWYRANAGDVDSIDLRDALIAAGRSDLVETCKA